MLGKFLDRSWDRCHPEFAERARALQQYLRSAYEARVTKTDFEVFETFRSSERQDRLYAKGTSKARGGQSAHNHGLAVDMVPYVRASFTTAAGKEILQGWSWDPIHDWKFLHRAALKYGLECPIAWDLCHVQMPDWKRYTKE